MGKVEYTLNKKIESERVISENAYNYIDTSKPMKMVDGRAFGSCSEATYHVGDAVVKTYQDSEKVIITLPISEDRPAVINGLEKILRRASKLKP